MFKTVKSWIFWWRRSRAWKRYITEQLVISRCTGKHPPPTPEQVKAFMKEWDLGWDSHMVTKVENTPKTYYEQNLN